LSHTDTPSHENIRGIGNKKRSERFYHRAKVARALHGRRWHISLAAAAFADVDTAVVAALPAVVAGVRQRQMTPWYFSGFGCALFAWPLVVVPALHALLIRPRFMSKEDRQRQRRADALALLEEPSIPSYPSRINELRRPSPAGVDRRRYVYGFIKPGEALELVREFEHPRNRRAVAYYHRGIHLGYVPKRHRWVADALDDGLRLAVIVEKVKMSWLSRRRARTVRTRLVVFYDGH
jgi:hypothetical protein